LANLDKYIEYCNEQVKEIVVKKDEFFSEYSSAPCYICAQEFLKIKSADELLELMAADYPVLRKNKKKIQVSLGDGAATKYMTETDSFLVTIRKKVNSRHQILDLIHEFGTGKISSGEECIGNCVEIIEKIFPKSLWGIFGKQTD